MPIGSFLLASYTCHTHLMNGQTYRHPVILIQLFPPVHSLTIISLSWVPSFACLLALLSVYNTHWLSMS